MTAAIGLDIPELAQTLQAANMAALRARMSRGVGSFLLIDPMLGDPVAGPGGSLPESSGHEAWRELREAAWQRPCHALELPRGLALGAGQAPYLLELTGLADPWLEESMGWAVQEALQSCQAALASEPVAAQCVGAWIESAASGSEIARQLSIWLQLRTDAPTRARYLRLADRRVWGLMVHVMGEPLLRRHLGSVQRWHWLDAGASLCCLPSADAYPQDAPLQEAPTEDAQDKPASDWLRFSHTQWAAMARGETVHRQLALHAAHRLAEAASPPSCQPIAAAQWAAALRVAQD